MYKPSLIDNLGRYIPNAPRHPPRILPDHSLIAIVETKKATVAIDVTNFFDYEMYYKDFMAGHYYGFELYVVSTFVLAHCKLEHHNGG